METIKKSTSKTQPLAASRNIPELLAPAGGMEQLKAAVCNGADAVYMGGPLFNARIKAKNFTEDDMKAAIEYAHEHSVKIYVTLNTLIKDNELCRALSYANFLYEAGADAVILQDMGLARLIRKYLPNLPMHLSTQGTVYNKQAVGIAKRLGFSRIVPAREMSLPEIAAFAAECHGTATCSAESNNTSGCSVDQHSTALHSPECHNTDSCSMNRYNAAAHRPECHNTGSCNTAERGMEKYSGGMPCEVEVFVHGALCMCYSGQCQMSRALGGNNARSGNRGMCAQPCRLPYEDESGKKSFLLSPKDICTVESIRALCEAGVDSFKIEGRLKSAQYVAVVTRIYRKYLDLYRDTGDIKVTTGDMQELLQIFNRGGFCKGYLFENPRRELLSGESPKNRGVYIGKVKGFKKGSTLIDVEPAGSDTVDVGDGVEVQGRDVAGKLPGNVLSYLKVLPDGCIRIGDIKGRVGVGDKVYKVTDKQLLKRAAESYAETSGSLGKKTAVAMKFVAETDRLPVLEMWETGIARREDLPVQAAHRASASAKVNRVTHSMREADAAAEESRATHSMHEADATAKESRATHSPHEAGIVAKVNRVTFSMHEADAAAEESRETHSMREADATVKEKLMAYEAYDDEGTRQENIAAQDNSEMCSKIPESGINIVAVKGDMLVEKARNRPTAAERVAEQLAKLGGTPFAAGNIEVNVGDDAIVPISVINKLRRAAVNKLLEAKCRNDRVALTESELTEVCRIEKLGIDTLNQASLPKQAVQYGKSKTGKTGAHQIRACESVVSKAGGCENGVCQSEMLRDEDGVRFKTDSISALYVYRRDTLENIIAYNALDLEKPLTIYIPLELYMEPEMYEKIALCTKIAENGARNYDRKEVAGGISIVPYILNVSRGNLDKYIEENFAVVVERVRDTGIMIGNLGWIECFLEAGIMVYGDYGLNIYNRQSEKCFEEIGVRVRAYSHERADFGRDKSACGRKVGAYEEKDKANVAASEMKYDKKYDNKHDKTHASVQSENISSHNMLLGNIPSWNIVSPNIMAESIPLMITEHPVLTNKFTDRKGKGYNVLKWYSGDKYLIFAE